MRTLREYLNLLEMPLDDYQVQGDFDKEGSFDNKNRQLLSKPKHIARVKKLLSKTGHRFRIYPYNMNSERTIDMVKVENPFFHDKKNPDSDRYIDDPNRINDLVGQYQTIDEVNSVFGLNLNADSNCITFVIAMNNEGEHPLSAWMVMHRFIHSLEDGGLSPWSGQNHKIKKEILIPLLDFVKIVDQNRRDIKKNSTLRSVKTNNMTDDRELVAELLVQYLVKGFIELPNLSITSKLNELAEMILVACKGGIFVGL